MLVLLCVSDLAPTGELAYSLEVDRLASASAIKMSLSIVSLRGPMSDRRDLLVCALHARRRSWRRGDAVWLGS